MSSSFNRIKKSLMSAMQGATKQGTSAYDTTAVVRRVEGDTAWVHIAGGVDETPVKLTIAANAGDTVQVRVGGGRAWITGNATAPPTDDKKAIEADKKAVEAMDKAKAAVVVAQEEAGKLAEDMALAVLRINSDIADLQDQIDGNITTWFYTVDPTTSNPPASEWIAEGTESAHLGDLYYNTDTGYSWRWTITNNVYSWQAISDTAVTEALAKAARAQDTADSKRRVFVAQPVPPYDAGDLWVQGSGGDILRCAQARVDGAQYAAADWVLASKYTDDSAFNAWVLGDFAQTVQELEAGISDAKVETFYQTSDPSTSWTTTAMKNQHAGDLWYNSTSTVQKYYRWSGTGWQELTATPPREVFDSIDGKSAIFVGNNTPVNPKAGDLWFKGSTEPILTYVGSSWIVYNKYTDDSALNTWLAGTYATDKANIQNQLDGKAETWYQSTDPSTNWTSTEKPKHEGDLWYNTSDNTTWYYTGSAWSQQNIPTSLFNTISGKANIFVGSTTPTDPKSGDLWLESASSDILTYVGTSWVKYNKYTDDTTANQAKALAESTQQYFWSDSNGAHITKVPRETFISNPSGGNTLIDADGVIIRDGTTSLAEFGASSARVGANNNTNISLSIDAHNNGEVSINTPNVANVVKLGSANSQGYILFCGGPEISATSDNNNGDNIFVEVFDRHNKPSLSRLFFRVMDANFSKPSFIEMSTADGITFGTGAETTDYRLVMATDGTLTANRNGAVRVKVSNMSTGVEMGMVSDASSQIGLYDYTNSEWIVRKTNSATYCGGRDMSALLSRGNFTTTTQNSASTGTISAGSYVSDKTATFTNEGYYPYGVVGFNIAGTNRMHQSVYECRLSSRSEGSATVTYSIKNNASASFNGTIYFDILWIQVL